MNRVIELDEQRSAALQPWARKRKVSVQGLLQKAVDEFIENLDDRDLLRQSSRAAKLSGITEDDDIEGMIREIRKQRRDSKVN